MNLQDQETQFERLKLTLSINRRLRNHCDAMYLSALENSYTTTPRAVLYEVLAHMEREGLIRKVAGRRSTRILRCINGQPIPQMSPNEVVEDAVQTGAQ